MGKRELVLISLFVVLGIGVYQFTAPPPPPGSEGVSLGGIIKNMRRGIQGARESATANSEQKAAVDPDLHQLRVNIPRSSDITITGEDRADVAAEVHVSARGFDTAEATVLASGAKLKLERIGDALVMSLETVTMRSAQMVQATIVLKVPRRLALRVEPHLGRFVVSGLASAEIMASRGETRISDMAGHVTLTHSGGALEIEHVDSLKLNTRNSHGTVKRVAGLFALDAVGGELTLSDVIGPLEIEARNTDIRMDGLKALKAPLRFNGTGGKLRADGLRVEARIDGRNTDVDVTLDAPAPVTIYNLGEITVTAPPGGYTLDAVSMEGRVTIEEGGITPSEGSNQHASGKVHGGGPALTLRATRGSITVRKPAGK